VSDEFQARGDRINPVPANPEENRSENVLPVEREPIPALRTAEEAAPEPEATDHAPGRFEVPAGYQVLTGSPDGGRRSVGVVVAKFNGEITSRQLERALEELEAANVPREAVTIVPVPGAFELPLAAIAMAKSRRYACIVALGCVIRGETPHWGYVAGEAASGLQLAAIETGVPIAFGVLTTDTTEQAEARIDRAGDAVRSALEMADVFQQLRAASR
jgi:6,7-dimethyl-8-ribityllumazine synthase